VCSVLHPSVALTLYTLNPSDEYFVRMQDQSTLSVNSRFYPKPGGEQYGEWCNNKTLADVCFLTMCFFPFVTGKWPTCREGDQRIASPCFCIADVPSWYVLQFVFRFLRRKVTHAVAQFLKVFCEFAASSRLRHSIPKWAYRNALQTNKYCPYSNHSLLSD
jgi:hypothetical protein